MPPLPPAPANCTPAFQLLSQVPAASAFVTAVAGSPGLKAQLSDPGQALTVLVPAGGLTVGPDPADWVIGTAFSSAQLVAGPGALTSLGGQQIVASKGSASGSLQLQVPQSQRASVAFADIQACNSVVHLLQPAQ